MTSTLPSPSVERQRRAIPQGVVMLAAIGLTVAIGLAYALLCQQWAQQIDDEGRYLIARYDLLPYQAAGENALFSGRVDSAKSDLVHRRLAELPGSWQVDPGQGGDLAISGSFTVSERPCHYRFLYQGPRKGQKAMPYQAALEVWTEAPTAVLLPVVVTQLHQGAIGQRIEQLIAAWSVCIDELPRARR